MIIHIVNDLEFFNTYPWREMSWHATIAFLHKTLEKPNKSGTYSIGGCPIPFQVWRYDTIFMFGIIATNKSEKVAFPRILRWLANSNPNYQQLKDQIFSKMGGMKMETIQTHDQYVLHEQQHAEKDD
ncbi:hypothetical protein FNV43_RR10439 [Rhamnella rubrinervis]|uniref:Uncharacterized protein n=1 Tax=Rhamnella rubrinervis TaxID=2594499 RepID=A0A8K0ML52_9ROSA|nr:hypothetical protein FNV43_RR10439 [Rhamnella rubrinervis]